MSEQKFLPRIVALRKTIGESHDPVDAIVLDPDGLLHPIEDVVYLSVQEHQHLLAEKDKRIERLREALEGLLCYWTNTPCRFDHNGNCQAHSCFGYDKSCLVADARAALQEETK